MRHPLLERKSQEKFVSNDLEIRYKDQRALLITGPNMGGKSTMLRTTCLIVIMAQIGCHVPADSCEFSAVDQIFTRVGASDKILENKSTFFLELEETKFILDRATSNSLIIMDELGRGTSTFDGYSLAFAVLNYLLSHNQSRILFTTHYHWLVDDFREVDPVKVFTMLIDQENDQSAHGSNEKGVI
jgi:DNA mismatch repair protein MSH6